MPKKKLIQNYQLQQLLTNNNNTSPIKTSSQQIIYETYKAFHITQKKHYTVKKLKLKNDKHSLISQRFVHQASILKSIKHPNISKPIKMLKTSTSLYVVYEYCQGVTLSEYMQRQNKQIRQIRQSKQIRQNKQTKQKKTTTTTNNKHTIAQKQSIIKQLCSVIFQQYKCGITHLCISPQCIFVNSQSDIKVTNYLFSTYLPDNDEQLQLQEQMMQMLPISQFTSPEVRKNKRVSIFSDVYSFGKVVEYLDVAGSKRGTLTSKEFDKKVQLYNQIIKKTTKRKPFQRLSIEQVYQQYFIPKSKLKKLKSMSMSLSKIGFNGKQSVISRQSNKSSLYYGSSSSSMISGGENKNAAFVQTIILTIIKRHNMSKFLIQLIKHITLCEQHPHPQQLIMLCTLLLKKSTIIINSIGKFMKYCKGIQQIQLNEKQRNRMMKSSDFIKLQPVINVEVKQQRKLYQQSLEKVYLDNVKLLQNQRFNLQLKRQQIDQLFFLQLLTNIVKTSTNQIYLQQQHSSYLKCIYIIMMVLDNGGIQKFFQKKITLRPIEMNQQQVFIRLYHQMTIPDIIGQLRQKYGRKSQQILLS